MGFCRFRIILQRLLGDAHLHARGVGVGHVLLAVGAQGDDPAGGYGLTPPCPRPLPPPSSLADSCRPDRAYVDRVRRDAWLVGQPSRGRCGYGVRRAG